LDEAVQNYEKFLRLEPLSKHTLVPTFQIDLIWHTHILASAKQYNQDCMLLLDGRKFHHDDTLKAGDLDTAFYETCKLWEEMYGSDLKSFGCLNRGKPPKAFFDANWQDLAPHQSTGTAVVEPSISFGGDKDNDGDDDVDNNDVEDKTEAKLCEKTKRILKIGVPLGLFAIAGIMALVGLAIGAFESTLFLTILVLITFVAGWACYPLGSESCSRNKRSGFLGDSDDGGGSGWGGDGGGDGGGGGGGGD
jgi:hypothetical protein